MHAHLDRVRALAGYLAVAVGTSLLLGAVALAALRPADGLAWVQIPKLGPDFGLDPGLKTRPLRTTVVAEVLRDRIDAGTGSAESLQISPILTVAPPPSAAPAPSGSGGSLPTPVPTAPPSATPTPSVAPPPPTPAPTPSPSPCNRGQGSGAGTGNCKR